MARIIPFAISNSADESDGDGRLAFSTPRRRASGHAYLTDEGLCLELDEPAGRTVTVPFAAIGSVVFIPGLLRNRLRITARRPDGFARLTLRRPNEFTALIGRRHRDAARDFVSALRLCVSDAVARGD